MNDDETSIQLRALVVWYSWNEENPTVQLEGPTILRGENLLIERITSIKRPRLAKSLISVRINKPNFFLWI